MPFAPTGALHLIGAVPLDENYDNTLDFADLEEQVAYFLAKSMVTLPEYTFIRKDGEHKAGTVKIPLNVEVLASTNYIMYHNYTTSKWIFCFITDKTYISEAATLLTLQTDVYQTYQFNIRWGDSFIAREHQNRWSAPGVPIYNMLAEDVTIGEEYTKEGEPNDCLRG